MTGGVSSPRSALKQLPDLGRYVMIVAHGKGWQFEILLGYYVDLDEPSAFPRVGVEINVNPNASMRAEIVSAMRGFEKRQGKAWQTFGLADEHDWGSMKQTMGLHEFLPEKDHVKKIREYFMRLLKDVEEFRQRYPKLPWNPQKTDQDQA